MIERRGSRRDTAGVLGASVTLVAGHVFTAPTIRAGRTDLAAGACGAGKPLIAPDQLAPEGVRPNRADVATGGRRTAVAIRTREGFATLHARLGRGGVATVVGSTRIPFRARKGFAGPVGAATHSRSTAIGRRRARGRRITARMTAAVGARAGEDIALPSRLRRAILIGDAFAWAGLHTGGNGTRGRPPIVLSQRTNHRSGGPAIRHGPAILASHHGSLTSAKADHAAPEGVARPDVDRGD